MKILVVVDMQNDFVDGVLGTPEAAAIVDRVAEKIRGFDGEVFATYDIHNQNYLDTQEGRLLPVPHCIAGTEGCQLASAVSKALLERAVNGASSRLFAKGTFASKDLAEYLSTLPNVTEIVLVGLCTDICVISNAILLKAFVPEVKITVDASCCAGVTPESHANALAAMKMCQINIEDGQKGGF